jgi:translocation and assembly module TamB
MNRTRLSIALVLLLPLLLLGWLTLTQAGLRWAFQQAEFYLPLEIDIGRLDGKMIGPIFVDGFEYQQEGVHITAESITIDWLPAALLAANINISQLHVQKLNIVLTETGNADQQEAETRVTSLPEIHLPWRLILEDTKVNGFSITQQEQSFVLNEIKLNASTLFKQVKIKQLSASSDDYSFEIKGNLQPLGNYPHKLDISWQAKLPSAAVLKGHGQLKGDTKFTRLKQRLTGPLKLTFDGQASNLLDKLNWQANVDASQFDLSRIDTSWPALSGALKLEAKGDLDTATLTGKLNGNTPETGALDAEFDIERLAGNSIQINQLKAHTPQTDTHIDTSGSWNPAANGGDVKLSLSWQNLRWPMQQTPQQAPWFSSATGNGTIEGSVDQYSITMTSDSPWPDIIASTWHANATGNLQGLDIKSLKVTALDGEAHASGRVDWSPELSWTADIRASNIDPASLLPQWSGKLNARLNSTGRLENDQLVAEADIKQVDGKLRNYPVSLQGKLKWQQEQLHISRLHYRSGKSRLTLQGQLGETLKLDWTLDSPNLAELYPLTRGELKAQGKLNGPQKKPLIEVSAKGADLHYAKLAAGTIDGAITIDLQHWQKVDIRLATQRLKLDRLEFKSLDIDANSKQLTAKAVALKTTATIRFKGKPHTDGWHGQLEQADVKSEQFDNWKLQHPAKIDITETAFLADTFCLQSDKQARLCSYVKAENSAWQARFEMQRFPLQQFSLWLPPELKLESLADGTGEVKYKAADHLLAEIDIKLQPGAINYPMLDGENDRREYRDGRLQLSLNPQGLIASSSFTMDNSDNLRMQLDLPGFMPLAISPDQPVKGSAHLDVKDLRLIESFIEEIYDLKGELTMDLNASGTLDKPVLTGQATIDNGSLQIPRFGLNIKEFSLHSQSDSSEKFSYRLDARSGDGKLAITGQTRLEQNAGWPTEISIKGEDFEVARIPEARVQASPDLQIKLKNSNIDISGKVHIPYAKLQPKDVTQAAKVSSDTVIIGGKQAHEEKWLINTSVRLTLGDRVHFYGFGFEGRLGGSLLLEDEPGQLTKATGEINIAEGNYRAYGQRLEVERGRAIYTGGPLTNPGLDVRAVRKVNDITAGLNVSGSLNQPNLEIFSEPAMSQTDALAYLILGRPLESADNEDGNKMAKAALALGLTGGDVIARSLGDRFGLDDMRIETSDQGDQAALVVGRYLSPKLYASYGVGLIESVNTISVRYNISKKWLIKAESGGYQGADILYTIER